MLFQYVIFKFGRVLELPAQTGFLSLIYGELFKELSNENDCIRVR